MYQTKANLYKALFRTQLEYFSLWLKIFTKDLTVKVFLNQFVLKVESRISIILISFFFFLALNLDFTNLTNLLFF